MSRFTSSQVIISRRGSLGICGCMIFFHPPERHPALAPGPNVGTLWWNKPERRVSLKNEFTANLRTGCQYQLPTPVLVLFRREMIILIQLPMAPERRLESVDRLAWQLQHC